MSFIPNNPITIMREFDCEDPLPGCLGGRQGVKLWEGRCAGLLVQSWPHVEQVLEIIDMETDNSITLIPVPGRPISFGTIKSVQLRTSYKVPLLVQWRIVLQAYINPIFGILSQGVHGHSQWMPVTRLEELAPETSYFFSFDAWADGILRYTFYATAAAWTVSLHSVCKAGPRYYEIVRNHVLTPLAEHDIIEAGITNGRRYRLEIKHDDLQAKMFDLDIGILDAPIAQA